ncbi:MAG: tetratricopeptide repeat protein [Candidatus Eisenbacteria bacterium]|uniref:Tetratricopeptide repeat protein n=1 Tax=Eiseniibacteriota bacterium TaxID=2212470 RepID=A0A948W566_UNCEI|nr:tetratricopeptide repeat protein [Candidatus Eisenbacteria bacterium]MBU1949301.1 tetratricopeptide repeat protein [Candidatus Eisenbacteria bacterium]MBU2690069.1 tetratricopeptide repeat protein [Candidatus Eisenbacteria bacterium]
MAAWFFNAERKIKSADAALAKGFFYEALKEYKAILKKETDNKMILMQAENGSKKAREGLIKAQLAEAERLLGENDPVEAAECCRNAVDLAGADLDSKEAKKMLARLMPGMDESLDSEIGVDTKPSGGAVLRPACGCRAEVCELDPSVPLDIDKDELFELYLNAYPEERAEELRHLGSVFRDAFLLTQEGKGAEASDRFAEASAEEAGRPMFRFHQAQALYSCGRDEEALKILEDLPLPEDLRPVRTELRTGLFWRLKQVENAENEARQLAAMAPDDLGSSHLYAQILAAQGKYQESLDILDEWLDPGQVVPPIDMLVIQLNLKLDRVDEARQLLERAVNQYFHNSLSRKNQSPVNESFGLGTRMFTPQEDEDNAENPFPLWAGRTLLNLYIKHQEEPDRVNGLVETLIMFDPGAEVEYRDRFENYVNSWE